jgi:hypothetical protein
VGKPAVAARTRAEPERSGSVQHQDEGMASRTRRQKERPSKPLLCVSACRASSQTFSWTYRVAIALPMRASYRAGLRGHWARLGALFARAMHDCLATCNMQPQLVQKLLIRSTPTTPKPAGRYRPHTPTWQPPGSPTAGPDVPGGSRWPYVSGACTGAQAASSKHSPRMNVTR